MNYWNKSYRSFHVSRRMKQAHWRRFAAIHAYQLSGSLHPITSSSASKSSPETALPESRLATIKAYKNCNSQNIKKRLSCISAVSAQWGGVEVGRRVRRLSTSARISELARLSKLWVAASFLRVYIFAAPQIPPWNFAVELCSYINANCGTAGPRRKCSPRPPWRGPS